MPKMLYGGAGNDRIYAAQQRSNEMFGGEGNDYMGSESQQDNLMDGGAGNDEIVSAYGNDTLIGGAGDDRLTSTYGEALIVAGIGNDRVTVSHGPDTIQFVADDSFSFSTTEINDFHEASGDTIILFENTIDDFDDLVQNHLRNEDGNAQIYHDNFTITLNDITAEELADPTQGWADNFVF